MQKKIIALAIAGLASTAAFAQSNVTIYGRADMGFTSRGGYDGAMTAVKQKSEFRDGANGGSRLGFKGAEDLGNGLKAIFEVEFGMALDQPNNASNGVNTSNQSSAAFWTNRHSYVGLTGGFGTVVAGRLDGVRYGIFNKYDAFAGGGAGNFTQMTTQYDRADNAIAYISPTFAGFQLVLAHSTNTGGVEGNVGRLTNGFGTTTNFTQTAGKNAGDTGNKGDDVLWTAKVGYTNGAFSADLDYETTTQNNISGSRLYVATAGASYDFGVVKVMGLYDIIKGQDNSNITAYDKANYFLSAVVPVGKFNIKGTIGRVNDKLLADGDATKIGLGVDYSLSKRTSLYANYGKINNDSAAAYALNSSANSGGAGYGNRGFDVGLAHNF